MNTYAPEQPRPVKVVRMDLMRVNQLRDIALRLRGAVAQVEKTRARLKEIDAGTGEPPAFHRDCYVSDAEHAIDVLMRAAESSALWSLSARKATLAAAEKAA